MFITMHALCNYYRITMFVCKFLLLYKLFLELIRWERWACLGVSSLWVHSLLALLHHRIRCNSNILICWDCLHFARRYAAVKIDLCYVMSYVVCTTFTNAYKSEHKVEMIALSCAQRQVLAFTLGCWCLWDCETIRAAWSQTPHQL